MATFGSTHIWTRRIALSYNHHSVTKCDNSKWSYAVENFQSSEHKMHFGYTVGERKGVISPSYWTNTVLFTQFGLLHLSVCLYIWIGSSIIVALILLFRNCAFQVEEHLIKYVYKFLYKNKSMNYAVQNSIIINLRYLCLNYDEASYDNWYIQKFCLYLNKDFICSFFIKKNLSVKYI